MRRFYTTADVVERPDGRFGIALDGRPLKTPARRDHGLPTRALAQGVADEWNAQKTDIRPATMPLTTLAATAVDRVAAARETVIDELLAYARTDLVCYRAEHPPALIERQRAGWDPVLAWLVRRYDIALETTQSLTAVPQSDAALSRLAAILASEDNFRLAALHALTAVTGSLAIALAAAAGEIDAETAFQLGYLDELYQADRWGLDEEAERRRDGLRADIAASVRFIDMLNDKSGTGRTA